MLAVAGVLLAVSALYAQLPFAATYDDDRQVTLAGPVTRIEWVNPHAYIFVNVRDAAGLQTNWAIEIGNPLELERDGWARDAVGIGDIVRIEGNPAQGTSHRAFARSVVLMRTGARLFTPRDDASAAAGTQPAPRWPDGRVRLGPPPGGTGYWGSASAKALVESGAANVAFDDDGLLIDIADADRVAPFLPWAKALYLYRQRTRLKDDPLGRCLPPGGPRQFLMPNGFQFIEQRELGRILVLHGGGNRNWRVIHTDGRPLGQSSEAVPSYYGFSVGRWEGDTLVVESLGYNERFWLTNGGLPHTEGLRLTERFTRPDLHTLRYEVTIDDPRTYTRPWSGGWTLRWVPDAEIQEYFCEDNAESTFER